MMALNFMFNVIYMYDILFFVKPTAHKMDLLYRHKHRCIKLNDHFFYFHPTKAQSPQHVLCLM